MVFHVVLLLRVLDHTLETQTRREKNNADFFFVPLKKTMRKFQRGLGMDQNRARSCDDNPGHISWANFRWFSRWIMGNSEGCGTTLALSTEGVDGHKQYESHSTLPSCTTSSWTHLLPCHRYSMSAPLWWARVIATPTLRSSPSLSSRYRSPL